MTVPLNNLYHFVQGLLELPAMFYLFAPHGSRKISNLQPLSMFEEPDNVILPNVICHDQEPLNWLRYQDDQADVINFKQQLDKHCQDIIGLDSFLAPSNQNLDVALNWYAGVPIYDNTVLLHSEQNSQDLKLYQQAGFIPSYYWAHAFIARDWYRYAEHDRRLQPKEIRRKFLIYSRGWSNTREYRLKFAELLLRNKLDEDSFISMLDIDGGVDRNNHIFLNPELQVYTDLSVIPVTSATSEASADYDPDDFAHTLCSVVLETEFDGPRIHLTEKTLRPIACAHPFILAAGQYSLRYLKNYGFETFSPWIDESYDEEPDSLVRLAKICSAMKKIQQLEGNRLATWRKEVRLIAERNQRRFFSKGFFLYLQLEMSTNINAAVAKAYQSQGRKYLAHRKTLRQQRPIGYEDYLRRPNHVAKLRQLRQLRSRAHKHQTNLGLDPLP